MKVQASTPVSQLTFRQVAFRSVHVPFVIHPRHENPSGEECDIIDADHCKDAAKFLNDKYRDQPKTVYAGEVKNADFPNGCYLHRNGLFFNDDPTGKGNRDANKICKEKIGDMSFPEKSSFHKSRINSECRKVPLQLGADWLADQLGQWVSRSKRKESQFTRPSMVSPPGKMSEDERDRRHAHPEGDEGKQPVSLMMFQLHPEQFSAFALAAHFQEPARLPSWIGRDDPLAFSTGSGDVILTRAGPNEFLCIHASLPPGCKIELLHGNKVKLNIGIEGRIDPFNDRIEFANGTTWVLKK
jgi:hypothetical protein